MKQKTIQFTIQRDDTEQQIDVRIAYCAATERGFESMTDKPINIFWPTIGKNEKGEDVIMEYPKATDSDYLSLAYAGIIAAYAATKEKEPIDIQDILYHATPAGIKQLTTAIIELRNDWYGITKIVQDMLEQDKNYDTKEDTDGEKNS